MINKKEKYIIMYYLKNLENTKLVCPPEDLFDWLEYNSHELFGMNLSGYWRRRWPTPQFADKDEEAKWQARPLRNTELIKILDKMDIPNVVQPGFDKKVDFLINAFKLQYPQKKLLRFISYMKKYPMFGLIMTKYYKFNLTQNDYILLSNLTGLTYCELERCFFQDSPLILQGIIEKEDKKHIYHLTNNFCKLLTLNSLSRNEIRDIIIQEQSSAKLNCQDFNYIDAEFKKCGKMLSAALKNKEYGVNIMLYGAAGTGKSEFAKAVCHEFKLKFYMLSENSMSSKKDARFSDLAMAQALLSGDSKSVIIMDEAEDLFPLFLHGLRSNDPNNPHSKLFLNRMLENNKTPVIWISNNVYRMDPAFLRRFTYIVAIEKPDGKAQIKIWQKVLNKNNFELPKNDIGVLVKKYDVSPAYIDVAVRSARLIGDVSEVENTLKNLQKATLGYLPSPGKCEEEEVSAALFNTDTNLEVLSENILIKGIKNFSCCLYGAPGTGKSAYARYLAEKIGLKVLHKRASDLFGSFVGETERNIARAFTQAHDEQSLLVFDEADSFLRDRRLAARSWEISQVNEMLTWMESHPLPFICTTNLMNELDKASLRRFTFKIKYDYLTQAQIAEAFRYFFGYDLPQGRLRLNFLTPGDFAAAKKKAEILNVTDPVDLADLLLEEQEAKGAKVTRIGFVV